MKLSYLVGSGDRKKHIFLRGLLDVNILKTAAPEVFIFTKPCGKTWKTILIDIKVWLKILQNKTKNLSWNNISWGILKLVFKVFVPLPWHKISWINKITFPTSGWLLVLFLWPFNGIFWQTQSIYNGSDGFPGFLIIFFMCWIKHLV